MVAAVEKRGSRAKVIPIGARLKARNLYINQGLPSSQVAAVTGLSADQVSQLACREGWTKIRRINEAKLSAKIDAHTDAKIDEVSQAIASECDELALNSLNCVRSALESPGENAARDAQAFSGTLKNLVTVARTVRGLDTAQAAAPSVNIAFFMGQLQPAEPTNVTPAIELRP